MACLTSPETRGGLRFHPLFAPSRKEMANQAAKAELKQREADRELEAQRQAQAIAREEERWVRASEIPGVYKHMYDDE